MHDFRLVVAGHADGRHAPVERNRQQLPHDVFRLIEVAVHIDQAGNDGFAGRVHHRRALRHLHARARAGGGDAVAADENDRIVHGSRAGAVDQPRPDDGGDGSRGAALRLRRSGEGQKDCRAQS